MNELRRTVGLSMVVLATAAVASAGQAAAVAAPAASRAVTVDRAARNTWTPLMDVLGPARTPVTDAQLTRLAELPLEAVWGALQGREYRFSFAGEFKLTVPNAKIVGRALTMRYLPVRPDLMQGVQTLAREGDWDHQYNIRAGINRGLSDGKALLAR